MSKKAAVGMLLRVAALLFLSAASILPSQARTVVVGIPDLPLVMSVDGQGHASGIFGDILRDIATEEGWKLQVKRCTWQQCLDGLAAGVIDIMPGVIPIKGEDQALDFNRKGVMQTWSQIYMRRGQPVTTMQDLAGRSVAVLAGSAQHAYLQRLREHSGIDLRLQPVDTLARGFALAKSGAVDAVAADHLFGAAAAAHYDLRLTPVTFLSSERFFAAADRQHDDVLATIDHYLTTWRRDPDSRYYRTLAYWQNPRHWVSQPWYLSRDTVLALAAAAAALLLVAGAYAVRSSRARRRARASDERLATILGSTDANVHVCIKDRAHRYLYVNPMGCAFWGRGLQDLQGRHNREIMDDQATIDVIEAAEEQVFRTGRRQVTDRHFVRDTDGAERIFSVVRIPLRNIAGEVDRICVMLTDITQTERAREQARRLTFYDTLTALPNVRVLTRHVDQALRAANAGPNAWAALLALEIDNFKRLNDSLGYEAGDAIVKAVAGSLCAITRARDIVSRCGGDEFMVLLTDLGSDAQTAAQHAAIIAQNLRVALDTPLPVGDMSCVLAMSMGVTLLHAGSHPTAQDVLREASATMHRAAQEGGNRTLFHDGDLQRALSERLQIEQALVQAVGTPQLQLHLQPQYYRDGGVAGVELLMRWAHPERGEIGPEVFIPLAQELGLMSQLATWSIDWACTLCEELHARGDDYPVSVNVSPSCFADVEFVQRACEIIAGKDAGRCLVFEVTEAIAISNFELAIEGMRRIAALGVRFSLDDFGTGYSNLANLCRMPFYEMKLDRSLVTGIQNDSRAADVVSTALALGKRLGLRVVAEGVEEQAQLDYLFARGCDVVQGFLTGRPMSVGDWLERPRDAHHTRAYGIQVADGRGFEPLIRY